MGGRLGRVSIRKSCGQSLAGGAGTFLGEVFEEGPGALDAPRRERWRGLGLAALQGRAQLGSPLIWNKVERRPRLGK